MKIAIVHNSYGKVSGEEVVVGSLGNLLRSRGHDVVLFSRSSEEIRGKWFGQAQGFAAGIYNPFARARFSRFMDKSRPDVVHIHNLFPLISPAVLPESARRKVPVVMTLHNFRLVCPNALLLRDGVPCHECLGGREWRCVKHNCERSLAKSLGYALRTGLARTSGLFRKHVSRFICLTEFQRGIHIQEGFPADRLVVIPNPAPEVLLGAGPKGGNNEKMEGSYVGYVGRVSAEKDVPVVLASSRLLPDIPFKIAGDYWRMPHLLKEAPPNVEFVGHLQGACFEDFFRKMKLMVFATRYYEGFPMTLLDAMVRKVPIVCTRIGGLPEIIEDGRTGLLFERGNASDLAAQISQLWGNASLREILSDAANRKVRDEYSAESVYQRLLRVYTEAIGCACGGG